MAEVRRDQSAEVEAQRGAVEDLALAVRQKVATQLLNDDGSIDDIRRELTGEVKLAVEETTPERVLAPEVQADLLPRLKARFDAYPDRHKGVNWVDVQASLEADPALLWSLNEMDVKGHEPDVYQEDAEAYYFGTCSEESPETARDIVYDADAQAWLAAKYPKAVCNGNAVASATAMGIDLMSGGQYKGLQTLGNFDSNSWSYLKTPGNVRKPRKKAKRSGVALSGYRYVGGVEVVKRSPYYFHSRGGFRGSLRVPKKK